MYLVTLVTQSVINTTRLCVAMHVVTLQASYNLLCQLVSIMTTERLLCLIGTNHFAVNEA